MIKDNLKNASKYYNLSPQIEMALKFLAANDLKNMEPKRYVIDGDNMYMNLEEYETKISSNVEAHRKYIDVQFVVKGQENIGVTTLDNLTPITDYDELKDIIFYNGDVQLTLMNEGDFMILYPEDAHLPCQVAKNKTLVKKAVVKIKI